jgi:hypothetical protein
MLLMFGLLSLAAFASTLALWARERGPHGHGLERAGGVRLPPLHGEGGSRSDRVRKSDAAAGPAG